MPSGSSHGPFIGARPALDPLEKKRLRACVGAGLLDEPPLAPKLGRYTLGKRIGRGGMGVVYTAYDAELDRNVAVKIIDATVEFQGSRVRMLREARALAKLSHPNVVAVYDAGTYDGRVWLAMELVSGPTMAEWLAAQPRGWQEVTSIIVAVGRGLDAAHQAGIIHRDCKPSNIWVGDIRSAMNIPRAFRAVVHAPNNPFAIDGDVHRMPCEFLIDAQGRLTRAWAGEQQALS